MVKNTRKNPFFLHNHPLRVQVDITFSRKNLRN